MSDIVRTKTPTTISLTVVSILVTILFGCKPEDKNDDDIADGGLTSTIKEKKNFPSESEIDVSEINSFEDFLEAQEQAFCERMYHCNERSAEDLGNGPVLLENADNCTDFLKDVRLRNDSLNSKLATIRSLFESGRLELVPSSVKQCLSLMSTCGFSSGASFRACWDALEGDVSLSDSCMATVECQGDAYCTQKTTCDSDGCKCQTPGVCTARKAVGADCRNDDECSVGDGVLAYCAENSDGNDGKCQVSSLGATAGEGESCTLSRDDTIWHLCSSEFYCHGSSEDSVCRKPFAVGEQIQTGVTPSCVHGALALFVGYADSTDNLDPLRNYICTKITMVDEGEQCHERPCVDEDGDPVPGCDPSEFPYNICRPMKGLACLDGECIKVASTGEEGTGCSANYDCNTDLYCAGSDDPACPIVKKESSVTCSSNEDCSGEDYQCESGSCVLRGCCTRDTSETDSSSDNCVIGASGKLISNRLELVRQSKL